MATPKPWPKNASPTPRELADWLLICTDEERIDLAERALAAQRAATRCVIENHEMRVRMSRRMVP